MADIPLKNVATNVVEDSGSAGSSDVDRPKSVGIRDKTEMQEFGKKQQLKRQFGLLSMVGFTCILTSTWESMFSVFLYGFQNGGPAGLIYGYIFCWAGTLATVASIAEMASMVPLSGGQYFWVYYLAPPSCRNFLSYLTGWTNVLGWQAGTASLAFLAGTQTQGLLVLNYPEYGFQRWHGTLLLYAVIAMALIVNTYLANHLPKVEGLIFILHIVGFFCILIPMVYLGPHGTKEEVFHTFLNEGGWSSDGLSWLIGLMTSVYSFIGTDSACHMAEEIHGASTIIPWSMLSAIGINGVLGFVMLIAMLFCLGDIERVLGTATGYPFIEIFYQATNSIGGATAMTSLVIALDVFATAACFTTASRMMWAFARDNGLPYSSHLARVNPTTKLPLYSIAVSTVFSLVLALINIASAAAFNAIVSLVVAGLFVSYLVSIGLMVNRRLRPSVERTQLRWGPWKMSKWTGTAVNIFALFYVFVATLFSFFPTSPSVTLDTMNWSVLVFMVAILFSIGYYFLYGKKQFKGPVLEIATLRAQQHGN